MDLLDTNWDGLMIDFVVDCKLTKKETFHMLPKVDKKLKTLDVVLVKWEDGTKQTHLISGHNGRFVIQ